MAAFVSKTSVQHLKRRRMWTRDWQHSAGHCTAKRRNECGASSYAIWLGFCERKYAQSLVDWQPTYTMPSAGAMLQKRP